MTPRQLSAHEQFDHWTTEEHFAALATAVRVAEHGTEKGFTDYIKRMTK